jgi:hypothetical protein
MKLNQTQSMRDSPARLTKETTSSNNELHGVERNPVGRIFQLLIFPNKNPFLCEHIMNHLDDRFLNSNFKL